MSAPALAPRPVGRPAPGRPAGARTGPSPTRRSGTGRAGSSRAGSPVPAARSGAAAAAARAGRAGATAAAVTTARTGATRQPVDPRPRMRVVERPDLAPRRIGFAVTVTALLGTLMLGLLLLNVAISGNAFTLAELKSEHGLLVDQQQSLEQQLLVESAPASLAEKATRLGMVPAPQTIVLEADGTGAPPLVEDE